MRKPKRPRGVRLRVAIDDERPQVPGRQAGAKLIVADPRETDMAGRSDVWLQHRPGTDVALLNGIMHVIIQEGLVNQDFVAARTEGYEAFARSVEKYTPEFAEKISGVDRHLIVEAARLYAQAERGAIYWGMGISQLSHGTASALSLIHLAFLTGHIGREGTGLNPLRGQNNVQGACDMGCLPGLLPGYGGIGDDPGRRVFDQAWDCSIPAAAGMTAPEMLDRALSGSLKALFIMGENPMMSDPDTSHIEQALSSLDFLVVQDIFLSETAQKADVVLPAASALRRLPARSC